MRGPIVATTVRTPKFLAVGAIKAAPEAVAQLLLTVRAGPVEGDNLILFQRADVSPTDLSGGPDRFQLAYAGGSMTIDVDRAAQTIAAQGGWWYRGEYTITADANGSAVLTLRVFNVAGAGSRWLVPVANNFFRGFEAGQRAGFEATLRSIGERLGCEVRLL